MRDHNRRWKRCRRRTAVSDIHVYSPFVTSTKYRVLKTRHRRFEKETFGTWKNALQWAMDTIGSGFWVFRQKTCEWHEPQNTELIWVSDKFVEYGESSRR